MRRVYVETSIPSMYFETRTEHMLPQWALVTRTWWDRYRHLYDLCTSEAVWTELLAAPAPKRALMEEMFREVRVLPDPPGYEDVAAFYIQHMLMPAGATGDASHLAFASMHGVDYLLTWNCRHLANANKFRHIAVINGRLGLAVPSLVTPFSLVPGDGL